MGPTQRDTTIWHFEDVTVDTASYRLSVSGEPRTLEPKSFRLLQFLIENRDRAVTKDEIFNAVWAGTFVSDNALARAIAQIRKALGDDPKQPKFIETIPTIGYRFIAAAAPAVVPAGIVIPMEVHTPAPVTKRPRPLWPWALAVGFLALSVAVGITFWRILPARALRNAAPVFLPRQFSSSSGLDATPVFSPDGNLVAYASDKSGSFEIYVRSFDSAAKELQLTNDGGENLYPAFSADGREIAFTSIRRNGIFRVPALGGPSQRLTNFGGQPVWSPDGRTIVFRSTTPKSLSVTDYYQSPESSLWIVSSSGGEPKRITGDQHPPGGQSFPSWSRDGSEIRFLNSYKGEASIWSVRVRDGRLQQKFASESLRFNNATFAPDDGKLWYVSWLLNGNIGIWALDLDPATLKPVGQAKLIYLSPFASPRDIALSNDGRRMAFSAVLPVSNIMAAPMPGSRAKAEAPVPLIKDTAYRYSIVRSSLDGTRITFVAFPRGNFPRIWVANQDGSQATAMGPPDRFSNQGTFSSDGKRLFFTSATERGPAMMSMDLADGSSRTYSTLPKYWNQLVFSPDGQFAVFHVDTDERRQIYRQNVATGERQILASGAEDYGFPRYSRDGNWVSLEATHREGGGSDIAVISSRGGKAEVILQSDEPSYAAGWMPDNDRILFAGFRDAAWNIYSVSRTTKKVEKLSNYKMLRTYVRYPDWLAGDRIAYEFNETKGNLFVANLQ